MKLTAFITGVNSERRNKKAALCIDTFKRRESILWARADDRSITPSLFLSEQHQRHLSAGHGVETQTGG